MQIRIERLELHHLEDCLCIERTTDSPWSKGDFEAYRKSDRHLMRVALWNRHVMGYIVFQIGEDHFEIKNVAVCEAARRQGIGSQLVGYVVNKIGDPDVPQASVEVVVRETRNDLIEFFSNCGFEAIRPVVKNRFLDTGEDGYI
ncbi:MAG TPA: GNAT family N-acetyltransferase, partial [Planctomycetaceae bacterium]|nr:GNAT family N-acetyltransferase [Planctomycetaceae bacterium]